ncbi:hypothetical protein CAEBREN_24867 [Caenorhabditis brenneri]|uniref:Uncharacterized protein n=1 Tax=Caenorhabditis brenneri TaxID=135651 RepID=G0MN03_CAEBE|nr:hypothetical protein CAEBREN_24867 [Caenorhabditis brenneri]
MEDNDFFTLRKICAKRIADYIGDGTLHTFKLEDAKMSNLIFSYCLGNRNFDEKFFGNVAKCLNVTEVEHNRDDVWRMDGKLTYHQNIESLSIMKLRKWKRFHIRYDVKPKTMYAAKDLKPYTFYAADIIKTLKFFVNRYSRKKLKSLTIIPDYCEFSATWMKSVYHCFPSLTTLNLEACLIGDEQFQKYICGFRHLIRLDVHDCNLTSLRGISRLRDLEYLDITGINVEDPDDIDDFYILQKLKTLIVATIFEEQKGRFMEFWIKSEYTLQYLEVVDFSFNKITEEQFHFWLERHWRLKTVCVIGTPISEYSFHRETPLSSLSTLNSRYLDECMDSLKHYVSTYRNIPRHILNFVFNSMIEKLNAEKIVGTPSCLQDCLNFMCTHREKLGSGVVEVMYALVRNRHHLFSRKDLNFMYNILVKEECAFDLQELKWEKEMYQITIWRLLWDEGIFHSDQHRRMFLHNRAIRLLSESEELDPEVARIAFDLFWSNLRTFHSAIPFVQLYHSGFIPSVLWFLKDAEMTSEESRENFDDFLDRIQGIYDPVPGKPGLMLRKKIDQEIVRNLWRLVPQFRKNVEMLSNLFSIFLPILDHKVDHLQKVFLEPETMESLLPLVFCDATKDEASYTFLQILDLYHDSILGSVDVEHHSRVILPDIEESVYGYVDNEEPGFYDKLSWILTHCRNAITEDVVGKFYQYFLDLDATT